LPNPTDLYTLPESLKKNTYLYGSFNKKDKEQKNIEKKILNSKIFEYHKDLPQNHNRSFSKKEYKDIEL